MDLHEVRRLVRLRKIRLSPASRGLAECLDTEGWRQAAAGFLPRGVLDYIDGGAEEEVTLTANRAAFASWRWIPRALVDVSSVDISRSVFGERFAAPFGLAPVGGTGFLHPAGERAVALAAAAAQVPYCVPTMANTSIEDVAASGAQPLWFQLYVQRDWEQTCDLVDRAFAADYRVLEITIDSAVSGRRRRELRSGYTIPPEFTLSALLDIGLRVGYWTRMLRGDRIGFPNLGGTVADGLDASVMSVFHPAVTWERIRQLRTRWQGPVVLKGIFSPADARRARDAGLDGVHLSNHGGRQLDRSITPLLLLRETREAVGPDFPIIIDSGIRDGGDVAVALALGADFCAIGRAYLYPLAVAGRAGVQRAIEQICAQLQQTMALAGVADVSTLKRLGRELLVAA